MMYFQDGYAPGPIYMSSSYGKAWERSGTASGYFNNICCSSDGLKWIAAEGGFAEGYIYTFQIPPGLSIRRSEAGLLISWPASAIDFRLQQNSSIDAPGSWLQATNSVQRTGDVLQVVIPNPTGNKFYRLVSP